MISPANARKDSMSPARVLAGSTLALVFLLAGPVAGQRQQSPVFRSRTDLVPVYVVAVDEDGNPVTDLTASDFTLKDRGRPQDIAVFDTVSRAASTAVPARFRLPADLPRDVASNVSRDTERVVVVVVDDLHLYRNRTERTKSLVTQLVAELGPGSSMGLLLTSGDTGTQITDDHAELLAKVGGIKGRKGVPRPARAQDPTSNKIWDPETSDGMRESGADRSLQDFFDNITAYKTLRDAAALLRGHGTRRKVFVLVSEGVGWDTSWLPERTSPCMTLLIPPPPCFHDQEILLMTKTMQRADITTFVLDPRGFVSGEGLMRECFPPPPGLGRDSCSENSPLSHGEVRDAQEGLDVMAKVSGGFAVTNSDDLEGGIRRIRSDLDNYYLLGFYPPDPDGRGFHEISVAVERPGVTLRHRQGYEAGPAEETAAPSAKPGEALLSLAKAALPSADLPLRLFSAFFPGPDGTVRVAVVIEVTEPAARILGADGRVSDRLEYSVLAADWNGRAVQHLGNTATVTSTEPLRPNAPPDVVYHLPFTLDLRPGRYQLRAQAISTTLGLGGGVSLPIDVPNFTNRPTRIGSPVLGSSLKPDAPTPRPTTPDDLIPFSPSLDREFSREDTLRILFDVVRSGMQAVEARLETVDFEDRVVLTLSERLERNDPGRVFMALPLSELEPGAYRLRITAATPAGSDVREVGVVVR
jgi:VWFA-related protein